MTQVNINSLPLIVWEELPCEHAGSIYRAKVPNGWLIKHVDEVKTHIQGIGLRSGYEWHTSITFVPDFEHKWLY